MKKTVFFSIFTWMYLFGYSQTWTKLNSGITTALFSVSAPTASVVYACGINGVILKTTDGGITWSSQSSGTNQSLAFIYFTSVTNGMAVGDNGTVIRTTNGGLSWTPLFITSDFLRYIWFQDASTGYITGGVSTSYGSIFKTTDGGATWTNLSISAPNAIYSVHFTSALVGYAAEYNGNIFKTTDGGASWSVPAPIGYTASPARVRFTDPVNGIVCAKNGIINRTTDAGASWTSVPSGTTTDMLSGLDFLDANNGFIVGGLIGGTSGTILHTTNGGSSWSLASFGNARIAEVDFVNPTTAYAAVLNGDIIKWSNALPPLLDARFTSSEPGCLGQLENFYSVASGTAGLTHTWSFGKDATPATATQEDPSGIIYSTAGAKLVTHIVSNGTTADTVTNIITINPSPVAAFTSNATACLKESINFTNTSSSGPGVSYAWDFGNSAFPALSTAQDPQGIAYTTAGSKNITLSVTNQFGCVTSSSTTISINDLPIAFAGLDKVVCAGISVQLGGTPVTGNTYNWQPSGTLNNSTIANPLATPLSPLTQYLLAVTTLSTGCKNYDTVNIVVNPIPSASFTSTNPVCEKAAVNFTNTGSFGTGITYTWDFGKDASPALATAQNPQGVVYHSPGTKTITFVVTNQYGCVTTATQTISIQALPVSFAGMDTTICANTSVQLGQPGITGNTYSWFPSATLNNKTISNPIASPVAPFTSYILTVINTSTGCKNQDTVYVTMLAPLKADAGTDGEICRHGDFQLGTGLVKGQVYSWSPVIGLTDSTLPNPLATPDSTTTYTVTVTGSGCGTVTDNVTILVHQLPIVNAGADDTITVGEKIQLNASGGMQYSWFPITGLNNSGIYNPLAHPNQTTEYTVTATDIHGCVNTDKLRLTVLSSDFWVPTAFTPDGNGISDVFFVRGEGIQNFECAIFNRWGEQIFVSRNIENGWDGKRQNGGEELPQGAYIYHIKGTLSAGKQIASTGMINLIR
jgi:gliding motility-associated-like protein